ncbi:MAG: hypothetical protein COZ18_03780 [Flexibacter sp. CG_4_10_14_3_um_filter_32_15]|nr:MAG: hypothetical protein COZ18_03780 [Flexibacter sp. CG_4_10_14_3_um_filter_32_15]
MNAFRNPFLLVVLFCSLFLVKCTCGTEKDPSLVEEISKAWKISTLTVGGNDIADTENFSLTLNQSGDEPTTFTIATGGVAYNFAGTTTGSWSLNNNTNPTQATFAGNTVNFTASKDQLTIQYTIAKEVDKNTPTVRFVLVPR